MNQLISRQIGHESVDALLSIHEYERQRMGQELHDSAGQLLTSLQLSVARLGITAGECRHADVISEIRDTVTRIDQEIRALAFLNHPMELDSRGLCSAIQGLACGFGRRTRIHTVFKAVGNPSQIDEPIAVALLRIAQEALVNIHRHSHASSARVTIEKRGRSLRLTIYDNGVGMPERVKGAGGDGIGIEGMRYRVETLGGHFKIENLKRGTKVFASVPLAA